MSLVDDDKLLWKNIYDTNNYVGGIAFVKKGFVAQIHKHKEVEDYFFIKGAGKLYLDGEIKVVQSPSKIRIKSNQKHAMTPISDYVILYYSFYKGPFDKIKYTYYNSRL